MDTYRPINFMILPTMACQASCRYCFANKSGSVMNREIANKALDFIGRIAPERKDINITFHGGEPLLAGKEFYRWILPVIRSQFGRRAHLSVQTNLWAIDDEFAQLFKRFEVSVGTSLDGPKEMCDSQRGQGYYDRTKAGEAVLMRNGMSVGEICTFSAENAKRAEVVFATTTKPYGIHGAVSAYGLGADASSVSAEQMTTLLMDSFSAYKADPAHCRITTIDAMAKGCFDGEGHTCTFFDCLGVFAAIAPDGKIYSCQRFAGFDEFCLGNVSDDPDEASILQSSAYHRLAAQQKEHEAVCGDCAHFDYCRGGCLYNAYAAGTPIDPYCPSYKALFDHISLDMAIEMGNVMLGRNEPTPVLAMAGDQPHPYKQRISKERMRRALQWGRETAPTVPRLRDEYPENHLNKFYLHLTFRCPLRCPHCYAEGGERQSRELSAGRFAEIIKQAVEARFHSVVLTGGEPLVYPGFDNLMMQLNSMDRKGTKLVLRTSFGFDIPQERMETLCDLFDEIVISVDGDRATHDARRGQGQYNLTVANMETACKLGAAHKLGITATLEKSQRLGDAGDSVHELAKRLGIRKVRMRPVLPLGRGADAEQENYTLCSEELEAMEDFHPRHSCGLGQNLYIEPDGSVYPCYAWCAEDKLLGNLASEDLNDILSRGELYEYCRHDVDTNDKCHTCEVRYLCGGVCKAWVKNKENIDSGYFDCTARKAYYLKAAKLLEEV